ncbi:hypothetical protein TSUD_374330 [Trifolium subterraneum]|uniref:Uncharacterized protein n=1 Tax=Trifolium subterraneum TaxID=3900 RepID=A0A2Z6NZ73_TRISU|nr:hypothetical protein TSUD_374330 [Trifolium subterraneum]
MQQYGLVHGALVELQLIGMMHPLKLTIENLASMVAKYKKAPTFHHVIPISIGGMMQSFGN